MITVKIGRSEGCWRGGLLGHHVDGVHVPGVCVGKIEKRAWKKGDFGGGTRALDEGTRRRGDDGGREQRGENLEGRLILQQEPVLTSAAPPQVHMSSRTETYYRSKYSLSIRYGKYCTVLQYSVSVKGEYGRLKPREQHDAKGLSAGPAGRQRTGSSHQEA